MEYTSQRVWIPGGEGIRLAGITDLPTEVAPRFWAMFTHCFTCTKDLKAIARISRQLARRGIATLRFDFTGLGNSEGRFVETDFRTNVADCLAATRWMAEQPGGPRLLIGHSLGGAALTVAAPRIETARCLVTIASPADTGHLASFLARANPAILADGEGEVTIGGTAHRITRQMVKTLEETDLPLALRSLTLPLMILFPARDETLPVEHGRRAFELAGGPASFVAIDGADHLLVRNPQDPVFVADLIEVWSSRYCGSE